MNVMIDRLLSQREVAASINDGGLIREINAALLRLGYREPDFETAIPATLEYAVPVKRGPGRPRKIQ